MRKLIACLSVAAATMTAACDPDDSGFFYGESATFDLVGVWSGTEEISGLEDIGSNLGPGTERGFAFPVVLQLFKDRRFVLTTSNFPTSFDNEGARSCEGVYTTDSGEINFFADRACRALPLTRYSTGRVLPFGMTLQASTAAGPSSASIRVRMRLDRD